GTCDEALFRPRPQPSAVSPRGADGGGRFRPDGGHERADAGGRPSGNGVNGGRADSADTPPGRPAGFACPGGATPTFDVDALHARAVAAGLTPDGAPRDAAWGERFFHLTDPDAHELSFATPLPDAG